MLNFREWFYFNEGREEKALASELAGSPSVVTSLSEVIPQNDKNTDKLLLLASYYFGKNKNLAELKTDMTDYIRYLKNNRMPLINVDLVSKKPSSPWDDYLYWTQIIHGNKGEDSNKEKSNFKPSDIDFQNEKPILTGSGGKIRVYKANNTEQCIILGKGQSFCISQPGNRMWQSYRDRDISTFYFVYDDTRDDRLGIVVVDQTQYKTVLTDKVNTTGTTLDPYTGELTTDPKSYMKYLKEKGIDLSKIVNIPKSPEEKEEDEKLGEDKGDLNWFISLSPDYKSKYIGRGHPLTNQQFDFLLDNKFNSLLTQYVKTGLKLNDYQVDKIAKIRDLKDNYIHNRLISAQNSLNLTKKEYYLLSSKQKEGYYEKINDYDNKHYTKVKMAIIFDDFDTVKNLVEKGATINAESVLVAIIDNNLDIVKYLVEKGAPISDDAVLVGTTYRNFDIVKYLVEKGASISEKAISSASATGDLDFVKYLIDKAEEINKFPIEIGKNAVANAASSGNLNLVKYLLFKGAEISNYNYAIANAEQNGHKDIVDYLKARRSGEYSYS
jgi:hypothetical protein